jgi:MFS family permease
VAFALALFVGRLRVPAAHVAIGRIAPTAASRQPALLMSGSVMAAVGMTLGAIGVLVPLRLASEGSSGVAVGVTFLLAAALAALVAPLAGAVTDRRGPLVPVRRALIVVSASLLGLAFAEHSTLVALLTVVCVAGAAGGCIGPCVVLGTTASERFGVSLAATVAVLNLAFASGESAGAIAGPRLAEASGELATLLALGCLVGFVAVAASAAVRGGLGVALGDGAARAQSKWLRSAPGCDQRTRDASPLAPVPHDQAS